MSDTEPTDEERSAEVMALFRRAVVALETIAAAMGNENDLERADSVLINLDALVMQHQRQLENE